MPSEIAPAGLRERKKEETRRLLLEGAARLFEERGFESTTVADIAAYANVSVRTFFRYFESKEALLLPDGVEIFTFVENALAARPADEEPLDAVCNALSQAAEPFAASTLTALGHPLDDIENVVTARLVQAFSDFEERLTVLVRDRLDPDTPDADLKAAVIACAALSAVRAVLRTRRARRASGLTDRGPAPLPRAFGFLREIGST
ncbi:TetR family transcriptional regulator [Streptomyces sp. SID486]|uniref:HTH tetR-type domain-containing protein n=1 Tax=Streptomyces rameus TaxID=68261 RepID=A0ABP6N1X5_9ACTN|nr:MULTISPECIES: TetR/AcrR family transcriptional regulator [unclassified Streptomyces]MYW48410.1 TetR family transcriptional regulator [Streptomyces sp. SID161]MYX99925.1 TetR family transcriptional regulator [Streptomyces sp. SID486]